MQMIATSNAYPTQRRANYTGSATIIFLIQNEGNEFNYHARRCVERCDLNAPPPHRQIFYTSLCVCIQTRALAHITIRFPLPWVKFLRRRAEQSVSIAEQVLEEVLDALCIIFAIVAFSHDQH